MSAPQALPALKRTPLYDLHVALGGKMVPFAGYEMPVNFALGVLKEHLHTRAAAGLFDVSHMGQAVLASDDHAAAAAALEAVVPGEIAKLGRGRLRYTMLLNEEGGIVDDLMVMRPAAGEAEGRLHLVVNAARKEVDYAYLRDRLPGASLEAREDLALLALQGPQAAAVLARHCPDADTLGFMRSAPTTFDGLKLRLSRCGYTGEDGFEISVPAEDAEAVARALLAEPEVAPVGLGARDSLRLEAGLCLYGHDIDESTSPVEADLAWTIGKRRREAGDFAGAARILRKLEQGPARLRVGIEPEGRAPAREGTDILDLNGAAVGQVTSGSFGPSVDGPVAMGYVARGYADAGTGLRLMVRGQARPAVVAALPFTPHRYYTSKAK